MSAPKSAPAPLSIREFARRDGCDESAVRKAIKTGHLKALPGGGLPPAAVGSGWRKRNRRALESADLGADQPPKVRTEVRKVRTQKSAPDDQPETALPPPLDEVNNRLATMDSFAEDVLAGRFATQAEAERVKENALALKHLVAVRRETGELVEMTVAEEVLFECSRQTRDAWLNWPSKVTPMLAEELQVDADKLISLLTGYVHAQLAEMGEPSADFRPGS